MNILVISKDDLFLRWVTVSLAIAGHRVRLMAPASSRLSRLSRYCSAHTPCDSDLLQHPDAAFLERIEAYCRDHHIDWVVPADLTATLLLARRVGDLKASRVFPLSRPELIEQFNSKWEFYKLLTGLGLPSPRTWLLQSREDVDREPLEFPLMIKPVRGEGGVGVRRIESRVELLSLLDPYVAEFHWPILAQVFLPGRDIDLSLLADHGRVVAWTIQRKTDAPGALEFLHDPRVLEIGTELIRETGYHGIVHLDMRVDERTQQPLFLEANPRFWGSLRHSLWSGVNFAALGIALARGENVDRQFTPVSGSCKDPGFSLRSMVHALLHGRLRPEGWSPATVNAWHCHLTDPMPEIWERLRRLGHRTRTSSQPAARL